MRSALAVLLCCVATAQEGARGRALESLEVLQSEFYHSSYGLWDCPVFLSEGEPTRLEGGSWWNCANSLEALSNTIAYTQNSTHAAVVSKAWNLTAVQYPIHKRLTGIDDIEWWALAWARASEVTNNPQYLSRSEGYFEEAAQYWDDTSCGGGVWWDRDRSYKNAITNELFIVLAARLHLLTGKAEYADWARRAWQWFNASTMINEHGLINDGLNEDKDHATCSNNGGTEWTYNQGVVLGGLSLLYLIDGDAAYLSSACKIADAVLALLASDAGILRESCESASGAGLAASSCNHDGRQFKGIFVRYLGYLASALPAAFVEQRDRYAAFVSANAQKLWTDGRTADGAFDVSWAGPAVEADGISQTSGLDLMNADLLLGRFASAAVV